MTEDTTFCLRCGRELLEDTEYAETGMCGDCYWDDQTASDGSIDDD